MTAMDVDHSDEDDVSIDSVPQLMARPMNKGETWYLLDKKWFDTFKTYLNDKTVQVNNPGPIDNGSLFKNTDVKDKAFELNESLQESTDYVFIPEEAWNILVRHFGIVDERHVIRRTVVQQSHNYNIVEVYPIELKLCLYGNKDVVNKVFSRVTKLSEVIAEMKKIFNISPERNTQIWANGSVLAADSENTPSSSVTNSTIASTSSASSSSSFVAPGTPPSSASKNNTPIPLPPPPPPGNHHTNSPSPTPTRANFLQSSLSDIGIHSGSNLTLEVRNVDGTWPSSRPKYSSNLRSGLSASCTPGLCGLMNLGNTCFMNSALQCMSNTPPLTDYFLSDSYLPDINEKNPLGMHGQIAKAYGCLIKNMWSGNSSCLAPREFKMVLGRFAPQFSGFQQQDCQELMASLLDGLHEDLNRITVKPYIELNTGIDQRSDVVVAAESWSNYKKRNDSIIIDTFHGLLKSTLVCPDCKLVSVTFDPFCYLSLPLPVKRERAIEVTLNRTTKNPLTNNQFSGPSSSSLPSGSNNDRRCQPIKLTKLMVPKIGQISDICNAVAKAINEKSDEYYNREKGYAPTLAPDRLIVAEVYQHRFQKLFANDDTYSPQLDEVHVYETIEGKTPIPVYLREVKEDGSKQLFGQPFIINVDAVTYPLIFEAVYNHIRQWFDLGISNDDSPDRSSPITNTRNGDVESDPDEGVACDENSLESLFSLTLVNSYGSVDNEKLEPTSEIKSTSKIFLTADFTSRMRNKYREELESNSIHRIPMSTKNTFAGAASGARAPVTLSDCINQFTTIENLGADDPWYCPRCKKHKEATKKFDLWSLPKVLIIHLKRFSYSRFWRDKLDALVDFPVTGLDMSTYVISDSDGQDYVYDLIAVANHYGGLGGGHYTAYGKNRETHQWHYFDDSNVTPASDENVVSKAAYVLFYQRREKVEP